MIEPVVHGPSAKNGEVISDQADIIRVRRALTGYNLMPYMVWHRGGMWIVKPGQISDVYTSELDYVPASTLMFSEVETRISL